MKKSNGFLALLLIIGLIAVGVVFFTDREDAESDKKIVAATIFPLVDIASNIAGDQLAVMQILPSGSSPHTFELTPEKVKELDKSTIVFNIGHGLDNWILNAADSVPDMEIITVDKGINLRKAESEHGPEDKEGAAEEKSDSPDAEDPHYWLSIKNAKIIVNNITEALKNKYPDSAEVFEQNKSEYLKKLSELQTAVEFRISDIAKKEIATFHDAWFYLADELNLEIVATFEPFAGKEPTPQYLIEFQEVINNHNITTIFSEPQLSNETLKPFANDLGLELAILDPIGGLDDRQSYIELIKYNVDTIINSQ